MAEQATVGQPGLTKPIRKKVTEEKPDSVRLLLNNIAGYFPDLKIKLTQAGMTQTPAEFIAYAIQSALMLSCMLTIILAMVVYGMMNPQSVKTKFVSTRKLDWAVCRSARPARLRR